MKIERASYQDKRDVVDDQDDERGEEKEEKKERTMRESMLLKVFVGIDYV